MTFRILHEDSHIVVCEKPPGVPSQSDKTGDYDMVNGLKNYFYEKEPEKGQPYIGLVHRLDRPVGGIMVFARTPFAAKNLSEQSRMRQMKKRYLAVLTGELSETPGEPVLLTDYLVKDARTNLSRVSSEKDKNAKKAQLYYKVLGVRDGLTLVEVELLSGRHHQIRVQLSKHMTGIWGDTKYNPAYQKKDGFYKLALYACQLEFSHPKTKKQMNFRLTPVEEPFQGMVPLMGTN